ncbi:hypothetical protein DL93DRAFT_1322916 [Clavulina sp. PMI_390]|nr:hypothetical protein DL93DRAFT_1322916 [Clavulina sp. PMI_390]
MVRPSSLDPTRGSRIGPIHRLGVKLCVSPASSNLMRVVTDPGDAVATAKKLMHMALQAAQVLQLINDCQMSIMPTGICYVLLIRLNLWRDLLSDY